jgi:ligand-binding SRPBCC domain-containing protein
VKVREFSTEIWLPRPVEEVFAFFSNPANLDTITPPWMSFRTVTPLPIDMRVGTLIDYRLRVRGIPMRWRSHIAVWDPPHRFQDEQVRGPYSRWVHEHTFATRDGGTLVGDHVSYATPLDFLLHRFVVRPDIERIFAYRSKALERLLGR